MTPNQGTPLTLYFLCPKDNVRFKIHVNSGDTSVHLEKLIRIEIQINGIKEPAASECFVLELNDNKYNLEDLKNDKLTVAAFNFWNGQTIILGKEKIEVSRPQREAIENGSYFLSKDFYNKLWDDANPNTGY